MSKRFRDKEIWQRPWYRKLGRGGRDAWNYINDWCDAVGVWIPDPDTIDYFCGKGSGWEYLPDKTNNNIQILPSGKWWVVDFCDFQYGELSPDCKPHASYIKLLKQHGLWDKYLERNEENKGYAKGMDTLQEKEKEKDKEKEKEEDKKEAKNVKHKYGEFQNILLTDSEHERLVSELGQRFFDRMIEFYSAWKEEKKPKTASDNLTIRRWVIKAVEEKNPGLSKGQPATGALANRPDAWRREDIDQSRADAETPRTKEELDEVARIMEAASKTGPGRLIARAFGSNTLGDSSPEGIL